MGKKGLSAILTVILLLGIHVRAYAANSFSVPDLSKCKYIYSYSGKDGAFFYGMNSHFFCCARVLPSKSFYNVTVKQFVRAVCQNDNFTYALCSENNSHSVTSLNASNGTTRTFKINFDGEIIHSSIAATQNGIYLIANSKTDSFIQRFDSNGKPLEKMLISSGVERLFINGSKPYAMAKNGNIYLLSGSKMTYVLNIGAHTKFTDAGCGFVFTDKSVLIGLNGENQQTLAGKTLAARNQNEIFSTNSNGIYAFNGSTERDNIKLAAAFGAHAAVYTESGIAYVYGKSDFTVPEPVSSKVIKTSSSKTSFSNDASVQSGKNIFTFSDGYVTNVPADTSVTAFKKGFDSDVRIFTADGNEITSGIIKTGYSVSYKSSSYAVCVTGDVTGEGKSNSRDTKAIMKHIIGKEKLNGCFLRSADMNGDGKTDTRDLVLQARD